MKPTIVPNYVTETGYTEDIPGRTNVGDTQDRRLLGVLNLKTGKSVWADGSFAPPLPADADDEAGPPPQPPDVRNGPSRTSRGTRHPVVDARGFRRRQAAWSRRPARQTTRIAGTSSLDPETGKTRVSSTCCTTTPGCGKAWRRRVRRRPAVEFLPDNKRIWFLSERDGWMHLYTLDVSAETAPSPCS